MQISAFWFLTPFLWWFPGKVYLQRVPVENKWLQGFVTGTWFPQGINVFWEAKPSKCIFLAVSIERPFICLLFHGVISHLIFMAAQLTCQNPIKVSTAFPLSQWAKALFLGNQDFHHHILSSDINHQCHAFLSSSISSSPLPLPLP